MLSGTDMPNEFQFPREVRRRKVSELVLHAMATAVPEYSCNSRSSSVIETC